MVLPAWGEVLSAGEDVKDSVLPTSHWQAFKKKKSTKKEIETKATEAGVVWFVNEDEVVQHILEVISRDEIAMAAGTKKPKNTILSKKAELLKDEGKMDPLSNALTKIKHLKARQEYSGTISRKRSTKSGVDITES